jgi:hypothetical protein
MKFHKFIRLYKGYLTTFFHTFLVFLHSFDSKISLELTFQDVNLLKAYFAKNYTFVSTCLLCGGTLQRRGLHQLFLKTVQYTFFIFATSSGVPLQSIPPPFPPSGPMSIM